ncbi:MAG: folylpolyglutamate synthase/dihydrofolate synthase family protein [Alphaproteobacteria bacterium]
MSRDPVEQFLSQLHHPMLASIDLSLDRMHRLLAMLGNPHKRLPPVIHVAGTNGKGSLLAYLQSILQHAEYTVHKYTSPHLVQFRERIVLGGKEINNDYLVSIVKHVAPLLQQQPATFFEATTAIACLAFAEHKADVLLLETGMGGRLDATNVIDKPLLTAITPIGFDHTEYLGNTLEKIAAEKAGIMKKGVPCVVGKQEAVVQRLLEDKAVALNAPLYTYGKDWNCIWHDTHGGYNSDMRQLSYTPSLPGQFQYDNAATAIACLDVLTSFNVNDTHIAQGIANARWPARIQQLHSGALSALVPQHTLYLDGGHNAEGGKVLGAWLAVQEKDIYLICGMMKSKDSAGYLKYLARHARQLYTVAIPDEADSQKPEQLAEVARALGMDSQPAASVQKALQTIAQHATKPSLICICGSLYLAGQVLQAEGQRTAA